MYTLLQHGVWKNTEIQSSDGIERDGTIAHHKFAFSDVMRATEFRGHLAAQLSEQKNAISTTSFDKNCNETNQAQVPEYLLSNGRRRSNVVIKT
jgi:hypothetical protein